MSLGELVERLDKRVHRRYKLEAEEDGRPISEQIGSQVLRYAGSCFFTFVPQFTLCFEDPLFGNYSHGQGMTPLYALTGIFFLNVLFKETEKLDRYSTPTTSSGRIKTSLSQKLDALRLPMHYGGNTMMATGALFAAYGIKELDPTFVSGGIWTALEGFRAKTFARLRYLGDDDDPGEPEKSPLLSRLYQSFTNSVGRGVRKFVPQRASSYLLRADIEDSLTS